MEAGQASRSDHAAELDGQVYVSRVAALDNPFRRQVTTTVYHRPHLLLTCLAGFMLRAVPFSHGAEPVLTGSAEWIARVGADDPAAAGMDDPAFGAESNRTGEPIGGGAGYSRIIDPDQATVVVGDARALIEAIESATQGTVIYVEDSAAIDLTAFSDVVIPGGTTIASGRGRDGSEGALLYTRTVKSTRLFRTGGAGIRLTGLRLEGPHPGRERLTQRPTLMGIYAPNVEIDNCEIFAWSCAAIGVGSGAREGVWVHHNYIHHNQRAGLGYGVSLGRVHVLIEGNLFDFCRHAIAGSGYPGSGYTARYNVHLENTISHVFDMHGARDYEKYRLVGLWHLDDGKGSRTNDYSIYNGDHDGTLLNMSDDSWVTGRIDRGLRFDGQDDAVDMGRKRQLSPAKGLTVAAWIKVDGTEDTQTVLSKADTGANGSGYALRVVDARLEGTLYDASGRRRRVTGGTIRAGQWHYVALTWDGGTAIIWLDGEAVGEASCEGRRLSGNRLVIGRDSATDTAHLRGVVDEVRLYSAALSASDIKRQSEGNGDIAGRLILMHHNTIRPTNYAALTVRGRPSVGCWVHHNRFYAPDGVRVAVQSNATGNFHVFDNQYLGLGLPDAPDLSSWPSVGHWLGEPSDTAVLRDRSPTARHGSIRGTSGPDAWEEVDGGYALRLLADRRWIEIPRAADEAFPQRVAVGLRMRIDELREHQVLLDNGFFRIYHRGGWANRKVYFLCRIKERQRGGRSSWEGYTGVVTKREISEGKWFDVVGELDGGIMRIYLDGKLEMQAECATGYTLARERRGALTVGHSSAGAVARIWLRESPSRKTNGFDGEGEQVRDESCLLLTGAPGYENDGVSPDTGSASTQFRFEIIYRDPNGVEPAIGFPRLHIIRDGLAYKNEAPVTMMPADNRDVTGGRRYVYTMRLPKGSRYQHFFEIEKRDGDVAKTIHFNGPTISGGSFAPILSWTSQGGYVRDGVEPEIGDVTTTFDFRVLFSDLDSDLPGESFPKVHILKGGQELEGSPFAMSPMRDNPTWQGRPYQYRTRLPAGKDYRYFFTAKDDDGNEAPRSMARQSPAVDARADIAPPALAAIEMGEITARTAAIRWRTDEPATSTVEAGMDAATRARSSVDGLRIHHAVVLTELRPATTYHYRIISVDKAGNQARSGEYTFVTKAE